MEAGLMLKTALVLLSITAIGGLAMAGIRFSTKGNPPSWLAMLHGLLAGAALTLMLYAYFTVGLPRHASWALLLFLVAAAGGVLLNLGYHTKARPLPQGIMIVHAVIAVLGYGLLVFAVLGGNST